MWLWNSNRSCKNSLPGQPTNLIHLPSRNRLAMQQCARPCLQPLPSISGVDVSAVETLPFDSSQVAAEMKTPNIAEVTESQEPKDGTPNKDVKDSEKDDEEEKEPPKPNDKDDLFHATEGVQRCEQMEEKERMLKKRGGGKEKEEDEKGFSPESKKPRKRRAKANKEKKDRAAKAKAEKAAAKAKAKADKKHAKEVAKAKALAEKQEKAENKRKKKAEAKADIDTEKKTDKKKQKETHPAEVNPPPPDATPAHASQGGGDEQVSGKKTFARRYRPGGRAGDRWDGVKNVFMKDIHDRVGWKTAVEARLLKVSKYSNESVFRVYQIMENKKHIKIQVKIQYSINTLFISP